MKSKAVQFLEAHQSGERSTFVDDAKWRQENASWLRRSRRVAYAIMDYMQDKGLSRNDVAEKLGVSPQYVSKILSLRNRGVSWHRGVPGSSDGGISWVIEYLVVSPIQPISSVDKCKVL